MNALKKLLENSFHYERTHQLVIFTLLRDSRFTKELIGSEFVDSEIGLESEKGLFDIGIKEGGEIKVLIELKNKAILSKQQLDRQIKFLNDNLQVQGVHLLLGYSDLLYYKNQYDEIQKYGKSSKIGYKELIKVLLNYSSLSNIDSDLKEIAIVYRELLEKQQNNLLQDSQNPKVFYCSAFGKIKEKLHDSDLIFSTLREGIHENRIYITNEIKDKIKYNQNDFKIFQEFENDELQIKASSEYDKTTKNEFKQYFEQILKNSDLRNEKWDFKTSHVSKYHKLAVLKFDFQQDSEIERASVILRKIYEIVSKM